MRNNRKDTSNSVCKLTEESVLEDAVRIGEDRVEKLTDPFVVRFNQMKEKDVLAT